MSRSLPGSLPVLPGDRARKRRLAVAVATLAVSSIGLSSALTGALFTDQATVASNTFVTGTVDISTTPATAAVAMTGMAPGDQVVAPLQVANAGSLQLRYSLRSTSDAADANTLAAALQMTVKTGVTSCTTAGFDTDGADRLRPRSPRRHASGDSRLRSPPRRARRPATGCSPAGPARCSACASSCRSARPPRWRARPPGDVHLRRRAGRQQPLIRAPSDPPHTHPNSPSRRLTCEQRGERAPPWSAAAPRPSAWRSSRCSRSRSGPSRSRAPATSCWS